MSCRNFDISMASQLPWLNDSCFGFGQVMKIQKKSLFIVINSLLNTRVKFGAFRSLFFSETHKFISLLNIWSLCYANNVFVGPVNTGDKIKA